MLVHHSFIDLNIPLAWLMSRQYLHFCSVVRFTFMDPALRVLFHRLQTLFDQIRLTFSVAAGTTVNQQMQSNTAVFTVNIPTPRRSCSWTYNINRDAESRIRHESTTNAKRRSNATKKHARMWGKRENWTPARNNAHGNLVPEAEKREPENEVGHMVNKNYVICPE